MSLITGFKNEDGTIDVFIGVLHLLPDASQKLRNHSPNGFAWGYGGSGPAQLALALLLHFSGDDFTALNFYQQFKWDVIARLPVDSEFCFDSAIVEEWLKAAKEGNSTPKWEGGKLV